MKNFKESLIEEPLYKNQIESPVNEILGTLVCGSLVAYSLWGVLSKPTQSELKHGAFGLISGIGNGIIDMFAKGMGIDRKDRSDKQRNTDTDSDDKINVNGKKSENSGHNSFNTGLIGMMTAAKKLNANEKDEKIKKENDDLITLFETTTYDENGKEIPFDKKVDAMKAHLPEGTDFDTFKKNIMAKYEKHKNDINQSNLEKVYKNLSKNEIDAFTKSCKETAKTVKTVDGITNETGKPDKTETSKEDTNKTETSKEDTNKTETSKEDTNKTETSKEDTGKTETSKEDTNKTETSKEDNPKPSKSNKIPNPPRKPAEIGRRPKQRGDGSVYYYKDDPEKKALDEETAKKAIKAMDNYKKRKAAWDKKYKNQKSNENLHELSLSDYILECLSK